MKLLLLFGLLVALTAGGCNRTGVAPSAVLPVKGEAHPYLDHAQPKLRTMKLWLGPQEMDAEVASTEAEISTGMMYRTDMAENEGMLFVFAQPHRASFYMRNTHLPLSCAYIDHDGTILEIHDMKPLDETPITANSDKVQFVLETKQGWFERNHVAVGAAIRTGRGTLAESLFGRR